MQDARKVCLHIESLNYLTILYNMTHNCRHHPNSYWLPTLNVHIEIPIHFAQHTIKTTRIIFNEMTNQYPQCTPADIIQTHTDFLHSLQGFAEPVFCISFTYQNDCILLQSMPLRFSTIILVANTYLLKLSDTFYDKLYTVLFYLKPDPCWVIWFIMARIC